MKTGQTEKNIVASAYYRECFTSFKFAYDQVKARNFVHGKREVNAALNLERKGLICIYDMDDGRPDPNACFIIKNLEKCRDMLDHDLAKKIYNRAKINA